MKAYNRLKKFTLIIALGTMNIFAYCAEDTCSSDTGKTNEPKTSSSDAAQ